MLKTHIKQRLKFTFFHIFFSLILLGGALYLIKQIWYPYPLGEAVGVRKVYMVLLAVDIILGPLLTFMLYKIDKKLTFDLIFILIIQISAYIFGLYTMTQGRPTWLVFVIDDIELVSPIDIKVTPDYVMHDNFEASLLTKPQWIAAVYSVNAEKKQQQIQDEIFEGINISQRPETYKALDSKKDDLLTKLHPIYELQKFNNNKQIQQELKQYKRVKGWLPVKAPNLDMVALFDKNGQPLGIVNLRPWL